MPELTVQQRLLSMPNFRRQLESLITDSARSVLAGLKNGGEQQFLVDYSWPEMLRAASLLAQGTGREEQDAALRIAQHCLSTRSEPSFKTAAAVILDQLTNAPSLDLAVSRGLLERNFEATIPLPLQFDLVRRRIANTLYRGEDPLYLNRFQSAVLREASNFQWFSFSAPTSAGKSFALNEILFETLEDNVPKVIVYIVPTRALIQQVEIDLNSLIKRRGIKNVHISSVPQLPASQDQLQLLYVLTQERLHWLLIEGAEQLRTHTLIVDEAQKIDDGSRGILLQQIIERLSTTSSDLRVLFSSPMSNNPDIFLEHAPRDTTTKSITSEFVAVNQNLLFVEQLRGTPRHWQVFLRLPERQVLLGDISLAHSPTHPSKRLVYVAHALSQAGPGNLVYVNRPSDAEKAALQLAQLQQAPDELDPEIQELVTLVGKTVHRSYALVLALRSSVAFHYGNMPLIIRTEIERLFKVGKLSFLVCTSTLIEGVNLPAKSIYLRAPKKGKRGLTDSEFWNLAGRAGRLGKEFAGNIVCVDTNFHDVWKNVIPASRAKYVVRRALESTIATEEETLFKFIADGTPRSVARKRPELEHCFAYFYHRFLQQPNRQSENIAGNFPAGFLERIHDACVEVSRTVKLPPEVLLRNPGISPIAQQNLFAYFQTPDRQVEEFLPVEPESPDAFDSYVHVIGRIGTYLSGDPPQLNRPRAVLVVNWMQGYPLARIISDNWDYWRKRPKNTKTLATIIRDSMQEIEEFVRFRFAKYLSCYTDVLRHFLLSSDRAELAAKLPALHIFLEFGASKKTQLSLMDLGLSRIAAIDLSEIIAEVDLSREQCLEWLKKNDPVALGLSPIVLGEIIRVLGDHPQTS